MKWRESGTSILRSSAGFEDEAISLKIVVVGNGGVGKSSMIQRFATGIFSKDYKKTIGVDFLEKSIDLAGITVRLMLWDTAGQEEFHSITRAYYRGAHGCVIVYSCTDRESFRTVEDWKKRVQNECGEIPMVLVHNKNDINDTDQLIKRSEGEEKAKSFKIPFQATSVMKDQGVLEVFKRIARANLEKILQGVNGITNKEIQEVILDKDEKKKKRSFFSRCRILD